MRATRSEPVYPWRLAAIAAAMVGLAACQSTGDVQAAIAAERRAEALVARLEALPPTPERDAALAAAVDIEAERERYRESLEALTQEALTGAGVRAVGHGVRGEWLAVGELALALAGAFGYISLRRKTAPDGKAEIEALERRVGERLQSETNRTDVALAEERRRTEIDALRGEVAMLRHQGPVLVAPPSFTPSPAPPTTAPPATARPRRSLGLTTPIVPLPTEEEAA